MTKFIDELKPAIKHGWNMLILAVYFNLCAVIFVVIASGFLEFIKEFDKPESGMMNFISFIVLSLTLAILAYTINNKEKKNENLISRAGNLFSISTILFFVVYIAIKGINTDLMTPLPQWIKIVIMLVLAIGLIYSIIAFVSGLVIMFTVQAGLWTKFESDIKDAKEWFINWKYRKKIIIIGIILYILLITILNFKDSLMKLII